MRSSCSNNSHLGTFFLLLVASALLASLPKRSFGGSDADRAVVVPEDNSSSAAAEYVELFCATQKAKAECDILRRHIGVLEAMQTGQANDNSAHRANRSDSSQQGVERILQDARVVTLPILTDCIEDSIGRPNSDTLKLLKREWTSVRKTLNKAQARLDDSGLHAQAERTWEANWQRFRWWFWLCFGLSIVVLTAFSALLDVLFSDFSEGGKSVSIVLWR